MGQGRFSTLEDEVEFRKKIEEYYLPKQLIDTIMEMGEIPDSTIETDIGIGFIDIANYTFISKFLSPKENQVLLNGLYSVFNHILKKYGGYLNKIEGDSIMFQYGGIIDPGVKKLSRDQALKYISEKLFYTCIEMQKYSNIFNKADPSLLYTLMKEDATDNTLEAVKEALKILDIMRSDNDLAPSINALFQIRIRIGANIGSVSAGNFGPDGSKHYDVIGLHVINAKRMESTAPVGGLRISDDFYRLLENCKINEKYYREFRTEAEKRSGLFANITMDELFGYSNVILKDKNNAEFTTYSVQVNPYLPEEIGDQTELLLNQGDVGAEKIVEFIQYYRGNRFVIDAIEAVFKSREIKLRKILILETMIPESINKIKVRFSTVISDLDKYIEKKFSLFAILKLLGEYQDYIKKGMLEEEADIAFIEYDQFVAEHIDMIETKFEIKQKFLKQKSLFYEIIFPKIFVHIKASIIEYQKRV